MDGDVKILLVSAGAAPDALIAELVRLGVTITQCSFAEAEESMETDPPDLVALSGALGAVELANMIDDLEEGPRMVIVAERKELAKLRGLNREVVVSLFAMETTERVVGQRIESLARRAARRRHQKTAPEPAVQKRTSLGLPLASFPGGDAEPKKPRFSTSATSGEDGLEPTPESIGEKPSVPKQVLSRPGRPPAPIRAGLKKSTDYEVFESIPVIEEELLESIRPGESDDDSAASRVEIPTIDALPLSDNEVLSHPPTLPPAAKGQKREPMPSFASSPGDLDLSAVEDALESLEGAETEIASDLADHVQKEGEQSALAARPQENEDTTVSLTLDEATLPLESETQVEQTRWASEPRYPEPVSKWAPEDGDREPAGHDRLVDPLGATSLVEGAYTAQDPLKSATTIVPSEQWPAAAFREPIAGGALTQTKKSGRAIWFWAAFVALGAGALVYKVARFDKSLSSGESRKKELVQASETNVASDSAAPDSTGSDSAAPDSTGSDSAGLDGSPSPLMNDTDETSSERPATSPSKITNPFQRPDVNKPSCEVVLQENKIDPGNDPVHEASLVWKEARAAIVAGEKERAHVLMCQAVALNPESAAIEGLAQHYLSEGSYSEARVWAEKAEAIRPGQREMNNVRGDIYGMMGDIEQARAIWLSTLSIRPEQKSRIAPVSKDYSVEAGRHLRRGDLVRAELFFRRAIILDGENVGGIVGLAKVYQRMNEPDYARAFSEMSLRISDLIPEVHVILGELSLKEGNHAEARTHFERALSVRSDFFPARRGLSQVK